MNQFLTHRILLAGLAALIIGPGIAAGQGVALVDVAAVFKAHKSFTQQLDAIRNQAESLRSNSLQLQQEFARKAEVLQQYEPNSQQFRDAEANLAKEAALLDMNQKDQIRQLMQGEAKLHYDTYQQVNQLIGNYCQQQGITLVLRFTNDSQDESSPDSIMQKVNSPIIYHQPGRNITPQIIALLPSADSGTSSR